MNKTIVKLVDWIFPSITLYVNLSKNKVEIKQIESGQSIVRVFTNPFSTNRLILSNYELVEKFLRIVIEEIFAGEKKFTRPVGGDFSDCRRRHFNHRSD